MGNVVIRAFFCGVSLFSLMGCGRVHEVHSEPKVNISVDTSKVDFKIVQSIYNQFSVIASQPASNVKVSEIFSVLRLMDPTIDTTIENDVEASFPNGMDVQCQKDKCRGIAKGKAINIVLQGVEVSGVKDPVLMLDNNLELRFRTQGTSIVEVCQIGGVKVKAGVVANFDGVYIELGVDKVDKLVVDLGMFGSYPSKTCDF